MTQGNLFNDLPRAVPDKTQDQSPKVLKYKGKTPTTAVYIGRPSKWGNPFVIGKDGTRDEVITKHRAWICDQPKLLADLHELRGKDLVCFCFPQACHGDTLLEMANPKQEPSVEEKLNGI
jgi:hypothetical protein